MLLLSCCAPCSVGVIRDLAEAKKNFAVLFFNPNIRPATEYEKRRAENERVCNHYGIPFIELPYEPAAFDAIEKGFENEPERGKRCDRCFELRLVRAAKYARDNGYTHFSSVLGMSKHKDFDQICRAASKASIAVGIPYDFTHWRFTPGGTMRNALATELNLYRQRYCGCKPPTETPIA